MRLFAVEPSEKSSYKRRGNQYTIIESLNQSKTICTHLLVQYDPSQLVPDEPAGFELCLSGELNIISLGSRLTLPENSHGQIEFVF